VTADDVNGDPLPLSRSPLWDLLREFFSASGVKAWDNVVPYQPTTNPVLADAYARIIVRFVQETIRTGRADPTKPFYVVELGAGSGKFGFHVARRIATLRTRLGLDDVKIVCVLTDVAQTNLDHWHGNPRLAPLLQNGSVITALFDVAADSALRVQGTDGPAGTIDRFENPLVVVANYLFDSIPQDVFVMTEGQLHQRLAAVTPIEPEGPPRHRVQWSSEPASVPHYGEPVLDRLLGEVVGEPGFEAVMFPVAGVRCLSRLAGACDNGLALLTCDLGVGTTQVPPPEMELEAFFYLPVDTKVLGRFFAQMGDGLARYQQARALDFAFLVHGFGADELRETDLAFTSWAESFSIRSYEAIGEMLVEAGPRLTPNEWIGLAALFRYDSRFLEASADTIRRWVQNALIPASIREPILVALRNFGLEMYWLPGAPDSYFTLGSILQDLGEMKAAIASYVKSVETVGPTAETLTAMGIALRALDRRSEAAVAFGEALDADPTHVVARGWLAQVQLELDGQVVDPG
jgi:hypothetical protein